MVVVVVAVAVGILLGAVGGAATAAPIDVSAPPDASPAASPDAAESGLPAGLVTPLARWHRGHELPWLVLNLPEELIALAFAPVGLVVRSVEETRADKVVRATAPHQVGTSKVRYLPRVQYQQADGLGLGVGVAVGQGLLPVAIGGSATVRLDRDWSAEVTAARPFGELENRVARVRVGVDHDDHQRYAGIGGGSHEHEQRALAVHSQEVTAEADLQPGTWYDLSGAVQVGLARQVLGEGDADAAQPLLSTSAQLGGPAPPPGFEEATTYATLRAVGRSDSRDTVGRPSTGLLVEGLAAARADVQGRDLAAATFRLDVAKFLPVAPEGRVLVVSVGASAAIPLYPGATIPLLALPTLGREARLRGYDRARFRDRYAGWASVEYRWPLYQYGSSGVWIDAFVFADGATLAGEDALAVDRLRYSAGGGLRFAHATAGLAELTIGGSPEGAQVVFGTTLAFGPARE